MASIQGIYLALFGRPADPEGLAYWTEQTNNGADLSQLVEVMTKLPEATARFATMSNSQIVTSIYQALFDREPDAAGLSFFTTLLDSGEQSIATIAINILDGAQNDDKTIIENRIAAANNFTASLDTPEEIAAYQGDAAAEFGRSFIKAVTTDPDTVPSADDAQNSINDGLPNFTPPNSGQTPDEGEEDNGGQTNAAPAANPVSADASEDGPSITISADFTDSDTDDTHTFTIDTTGTKGSVTNNEDGTFSYDPNGQFEALNDGEQATDSFTYTVKDAEGAESTQTVTVTINGATDVEPVTPRINEVHYDNAGTDTGEFVEIRVGAGDDVSGLKLELYNGSNGSVYNSATVSSMSMTTDGTFDYYVLNLPANGIQNGSPDGMALSNAEGVIEFLSYEGTLTASGGAANGMTSTDIGVEEPGTTAEGLSLQRTGDAATDWTGPIEETKGASNEAAPEPVTPRINEVHYDNEGTDSGEFVEIRVGAGDDVSGLALELYNGNNGSVYDTATVSSMSMTTDGTYDYYVLNLPANGIQNGAPDGMALSNAEGVIEFLSYEGTFTASGGAADGMTSTDIGVEEPGSTAVGMSLQRTGDAATDWTGPVAETKGLENAEDGGNNGGEPGNGGDITLISSIQGTGSASLMVNQSVTVQAVVTYSIGAGYFLQEEASDYDNDVLTSEGIYVYTEGNHTVNVGDLIMIEATVTEYYDLTELKNVSSTTVVQADYGLPDYTDIYLPTASADTLEAYEGMRVSLSSSDAENPLTVIENYNLGRYGELAVSAGTQMQPTQIYDAQTEATEIAALAEQNANNRIILDDGNSAENPSEIPYIPMTAALGDNGNGYLDSGDDFSLDATLRNGAEINAPINGVLTYAYGDYTMFVDGTISVDEATNSGARDSDPEDVGGTLKVAGFNVENFFTTLNERGATSTFDLERQTEKTVEAMFKIDADVFGLQELENNGFGEGSSIATLVDALNAKYGAEVYDYVTYGSATQIGSDQITTGIIYKVAEVDLLGSSYLVYDDGGYQRNRPTTLATFEDKDTGEIFSVASNHFKSKGDSDLTDTSNPNYDQGDGQGFWNQVRTDAANQLADWLATDPTESGDTDVLLVGDFNAYAKEDPVQAIEAKGFTDLAQELIGEDAYSYVYDGQQGTLDYGFASESMLSQISGVTEWHINADEPSLLGYSSQYNDAGFYNSDPFAASDHDPLIIGLNLQTPNEVAFA